MTPSARVAIVSEGEVDGLNAISGGDDDLEVEPMGDGEPVVVIPTALG